jgi:hypothetical protein
VSHYYQFSDPGPGTSALDLLPILLEIERRRERIFRFVDHSSLSTLNPQTGHSGCLQVRPHVALNVFHEISYVSNMVPDLLQIAPFHLFPVFEADDDERANMKLEILHEMQVFGHLHVYHPPFDPSALEFIGESRVNGEF